MKIQRGGDDELINKEKKEESFLSEYFKRVDGGDFFVVCISEDIDDS